MEVNKKEEKNLNPKKPKQRRKKVRTRNHDNGFLKGNVLAI